MTEIDPRPRQLLRDYAREHVIVDQFKVIIGDQPPETGVLVKYSGGERLVIGMRGELFGLVFEALQGVLELAESDGIVTAEEIFVAVRKPFER